MADPQLEEMNDELELHTELLGRVVELLNGLQGKTGAKGPKADADKGGIGGLATAALGAAGALTAITGVAAGFVSALNPALAQMFGTELRNLQATIGGALSPIIANAIPIVRELSGIVLELSETLKPIINDVSSALGGAFIAVVRAAAVVFEALVIALKPVIDLFVMLVGIVSQLIEVGAAFIKALVSAITGTLGLDDGFKSAIEELKKTLSELSRAVLVASVALLQLVGADELVKKFRDNLAKTIEDRKRPRGGLLAAPTSSGTSDIEAIARRFSERAFIATRADAAKPPDVALLEAILEDVNELVANPNSWEEMITRAIQKAFEVTPPTREVADAVLDASATTSDRWRAARAGRMNMAEATGAVVVGWLADVGLFD